MRAVLEGVAFSLRDVFELVRETSPEPLRDLRASGGGTQQPAVAPDHRRRAGRAAVIHAHGRGRRQRRGHPGRGGRRLVPDGGRRLRGHGRGHGHDGAGPDAGAYDGAYAVYRDLYPALRPSFVALADG